MGGLCSTGVKPAKVENVAPIEEPGTDNAEGLPLTVSIKKDLHVIYNLYPAEYDPAFPKEIVGTFSNHGIEPEFDQGKNLEPVKVKANQDRGSVDFPFAGDNRQALFCCLDGHGKDGDKVSQFCMENIHDLMEGDLAKLMANPATAFIDAFKLVDEKLRRSEINSHSSGTSCVAAYIVEDKIWTANTGDSRAVMGKKVGADILAHDLTWDQKPDSEGEKERIIEAGGLITPPEEVGLSSRVWLPNGRYGLSMSRSLGDHLLSPLGVIAEPEVEEYKICDEDQFMILATDGIWEFIDSQAAVDIVGQYTNATEACYDLIHTATKLWKSEEGDYRDDITAIVIMVPAQRKHMKKSKAERVQDSPSTNVLKKKKSMTLFPDETQAGVPLTPAGSLGSDGSEQGATTTVKLPGEPSPTRKPNAKVSQCMMKKAKTFRKRRLSTNPMDVALMQEAKRLHEEENLAENSQAPPEKMIPKIDVPDEDGKVERKRRLSISPDMDQTGKQLAPEGM